MELRLVPLVVLASLTLCGCSQFYSGFQSGYHFKMGDRYFRSNDYKSAEKELKESIDASTGFWEEKAKALVRLGQIYSDGNKDSEADSSFKEAMEIFAKNEDDKHMKSNFLQVKDYWIIGLHNYATYCEKHNRKAEAHKLEQKAGALESSK